MNEILNVVTIPNGKSYISYVVAVQNKNNSEINRSFMRHDFIGLLPKVPFVEITDIFVNPKDRYKGIGSDLIKGIVEECSDKAILVAVGASTKEYPEEPSDDDKIKITNEVVKFYEKNGFVDVNELIAGYEFKRAMIYIGNEFGKKIYSDLKSEYKKYDERNTIS